MSISFSKAPHIEGVHVPPHPSQAPNAALLIDFDNVTMGMRSDLSKELKTLLSSDVIRGKVTVQRAYADWRRYPQYIVPLSEASIDLIFAPAYGSNKKNATDIRMAIDGMELVFTRPEIGTYILLTGDSDFSSLVLKLKEYGKYVIGVGIQESSSDILVQNCDEYYSYTSLSGLRKTDESGQSGTDPWVLVERAAEQMTKRGDVMRSDRLKQVMLEIDPGFDEKSFGFNKFSRFVSEASSKGLIQIRRMENGQYEIVAREGKKSDERRGSTDERRGSDRRPERSGRGGRDRGRSNEASTREGSTGRRDTSSKTASPEELNDAYALMRKAIAELLQDQDSDSVRDSDVKRRMLALQSGFDEAEFGFPKFSRFLQRADEDDIIDLRKGDEGNYHVSPGAVEQVSGEDAGERAEAAPTPTAAPAPTSAPTPELSSPPESGVRSGRLRPREAAGRKDDGGPPPLFAGQVVTSTTAPGAAASRPAGGEADATGAKVSEGSAATGPVDPTRLRLPTGRESIIQYLSNSYGGVGRKTAETLADGLGDEIWTVLQNDVKRIESLLPPARAEKVFEGWDADFKRRMERHAPDFGSSGESAVVEEIVARDVAEQGGEPDTVEDRGPSDDGAGEASESTDSPRARRGRRTRGGGR